MLAEQAEKRKYLRGLKSGATQLAIEQVGKEDILAQEIAGRKDIELIKTGAKKEEMTPEFVTVFQENLSTYPGKTQVANPAIQQFCKALRQIGGLVGNMQKVDSTPACPSKSTI